MELFFISNSGFFFFYYELFIRLLHSFFLINKHRDGTIRFYFGKLKFESFTFTLRREKHLHTYAWFHLITILLCSRQFLSSVDRKENKQRAENSPVWKKQKQSLSFRSWISHHVVQGRLFFSQVWLLNYH